MKRWPTMPLAEVCFAKSGNSKIIKGTLPTQNDGNLFPAYSATGQDVFSDGFDFDGDGIVISAVGARCGKCFLAKGKWRAIANTHVVLPKPDKANVRYLWYLLNDESFWVRGGTAQPFVKVGDSLKKVVAVPPLGEQERIVKLLDEADGLRKLRTQADRRTDDLIPALFDGMFGDVVTNPKGWPVKPFGELASNQDGRRKPVKASDRAARKGKYPYYGASGIIDYVEEYLFDETALLIGEDGANLLARSTPIAFLAHGKYWVNNHAHVVTDNGKADLNYLCVALNLRDLTDYVTGSAQPKLNQANMNRMQIPVPPLTLQKEFTVRVSEIRAMEAEQTASRHRLGDLFQSLLHRAFNGEL